MKVDEARLSELLAKDESTLSRADVEYLVEAGVWRPSVAEGWAKKTGTRPFAVRPSAADFDPLGERHWSITMAIAWIMARNPDAVRQCWVRYLSLCYEWLAYPPNQNITNHHPYKLVTPLPNIYNEYSIQHHVSSTQATSLLRVKLESGLISATGMNKDRVRKIITNIEWCDLSFVYQSFFSMGFEPIDGTIKLNKNEDLFAHKVEEDYEYTRVLLEVSDILKEFPVDDNLRTTNRRVSEEEAKSYLIREINRRDGFIDQATAAELVRRIDPTFKRDSVRSLVKSLTGNEKRGRRRKTTQSATENGEKVSSA